MRNIVILVGSMRKGGNTDLLARKFAEGAAELPNLFDPILMQYQMVLDFFHLQDCGKVLVRGVKDKGDIIGRPEMDAAYQLGRTIK
ncbi:MAG: hypothetical protein IK134_02640 [Oscillospiraceae bacterium]|jgi:hypothetical protein|nr:hypothetical protein [Oscillospiraceae bacterium]